MGAITKAVKTMMNKGKPTEGTKHTASCESVGDKGDGVFKINGFVIFVPETEQGREYTIQITKVREKCGFGKVVEPQYAEEEDDDSDEEYSE